MPMVTLPLDVIEALLGPARDYARTIAMPGDAIVEAVATAEREAQAVRRRYEQEED